MLHILLEMLVYCCIAGGNLTAPCKKGVDICNEVLSVVTKELFFIIAWRKRLYVQGMGVFITVYFYQSFLLGLFYFCIFFFTRGISGNFIRNIGPCGVGKEGFFILSEYIASSWSEMFFQSLFVLTSIWVHLAEFCEFSFYCLHSCSSKSVRDCTIRGRQGKTHFISQQSSSSPS